ncbi:Uncharacterised protein [Segatella copri]|nr:Uncharacterised protein [Segatella copri]
MSNLEGVPTLTMSSRLSPLEFKRIILAPFVRSALTGFTRTTIEASSFTSISLPLTYSTIGLASLPFSSPNLESSEIKP